MMWDNWTSINAIKLQVNVGAGHGVAGKGLIWGAQRPWFDSLSFSRRAGHVDTEATVNLLMWGQINCMRVDLVFIWTMFIGVNRPWSELKWTLTKHQMRTHSLWRWELFDHTDCPGGLKDYKNHIVLLSESFVINIYFLHSDIITSSMFFVC